MYQQIKEIVKNKTIYGVVFSPKALKNVFDKAARINVTEKDYGNRLKGIFNADADAKHLAFEIPNMLVFYHKEQGIGIGKEQVIDVSKQANKMTNEVNYIAHIEKIPVAKLVYKKDNGGIIRFVELFQNRQICFYRHQAVLKKLYDEALRQAKEDNAMISMLAINTKIKGKANPYLPILKDWGQSQVFLH